MRAVTSSVVGEISSQPCPHVQSNLLGGALFGIGSRLLVGKRSARAVIRHVRECLARINGFAGRNIHEIEGNVQSVAHAQDIGILRFNGDPVRYPWALCRSDRLRERMFRPAKWPKAWHCGSADRPVSIARVSRRLPAWRTPTHHPAPRCHIAAETRTPEAAALQHADQSPQPNWHVHPATILTMRSGTTITLRT